MSTRETPDRFSEDEFSLIDVVASADWQAYHDIRRTVLFEARGLRGYDANHPDEHVPTNHPLLLKCKREGAVGTVRLDQRPDSGGIVRMVAIRGDRRRRGVGRIMMTLLEKRARSWAMETLYVNSARDAVGFYEKLGFRPFIFDPTDTAFTTGGVQMQKLLHGI